MRYEVAVAVGLAMLVLALPTAQAGCVQDFAAAAPSGVPRDPAAVEGAATQLQWAAVEYHDGMAWNADTFLASSKTSVGAFVGSSYPEVHAWYRAQLGHAGEGGEVVSRETIRAAVETGASVGDVVFADSEELLVPSDRVFGGLEGLSAMLTRMMIGNVYLLEREAVALLNLFAWLAYAYTHFWHYTIAFTAAFSVQGGNLAAHIAGPVLPSTLALATCAV
jgi:hypothetical protein